MPWEDFVELDEFKDNDNVDVYHFYTVYKEIYFWFKEKSAQDIILFKENFLNRVYFIWNDIDKSIKNSIDKPSSESVFLDHNAKNIELTGSELIKAFFILDCQKNNSREIAKLKSNELALEWDMIENKLQDNSFWFFICDNDKYNDIPTRIDFLFDIVNEKSKRKKVSYRIYEKRFKEKEDLKWMDFKNNYNKLTEWFENKEFYHFIGFLIVSKIKNLNLIIDLSKGKNKSDFKDGLKEWIINEFKKTKKDDSKEDYCIYDLDKLDFDKSKDECKKVLLLLNILYSVNNLSNNKFPFELYKQENWSVEHINPQTPRNFENVNIVRKWLKICENYYNKQETLNENLIPQIQKVLTYFEEVKSDDKRNLEDLKLDKAKIAEFDNLIKEINSDLSIHSISNLALLDKNSNSRLSNKPFWEKRDLVLEFDKNGKYTASDKKVKNVFIPVCTKNVFSKIYTTGNNTFADPFFGKIDMDLYFDFIEEQLDPFYNKLKNEK